jgi:hypothetical protein
MQSFVAGVVNEIGSTGRNKFAAGCGSLRAEWSRSCISLGNGLAVLLPMVHHDYREQSQNRGGSQAEA